MIKCKTGTEAGHASVLRSVVVRIVLVMTVAFNLNFSISFGRDKAHCEAGPMSDKAKQLAAEVNKRQADQHTKNQLQLHKAGILRAKGFDFWNKFAIAFREEVADFNGHLQNDEYQIESFDDRTTPYTIKLHGKFGTHASCKVDIEGQRIFLAGERQRNASKLSKSYGLTVDDEDNIDIRDDTVSGGGGSVVSESTVIFEVLQFFAQ